MTNRTVADPTWQGLYQAGAISAGIATALYVIGLVRVFATPTPPANPTGAQMLAYVDANRALYYIKQALWLLPSLPMIVVSLALTVAGWRVARSLTLISGTVSVAAWAGSFAWLTSGEGSLAKPLLAYRFVRATTDADRLVAIAWAETLMAINEMATPLGILQTAGILLLGLLMLRSVLEPGLAWLTMGTGLFGVIAETFRAQLGWAYAFYGLLLFVWLGWVAVALWRLAGEMGKPVAGR